MKRNPVIPYVMIAVIGITMMIIVSFVALNQAEKAEEAKENGGEQQQEEGASSGDPEEIFQQNCASCHGSDLSGGAGPPLKGVGSKLSEEDIANVIQNGQGTMPPGLISGEEKDSVSKWLSEQ
ncbi:cytochrome c550 [Pontibacillus litoralis]|uniref:Cytochrome C551 n=1 Tax=Pontibacillus litoralis JSM 072002 TaxID=1385512 RepID=A0A0A5GCI4_9BACI|nr:cytochrome c [Pontibacillus litoralis]KGX88903.1 cytochrome C551 [Pontibacillus litoralis JSM 072002]